MKVQKCSLHHRKDIKDYQNNSILVLRWYIMYIYVSTVLNSTTLVLLNYIWSSHQVLCLSEYKIFWNYSKVFAQPWDPSVFSSLRLIVSDKKNNCVIPDTVIFFRDGYCTVKIPTAHWAHLQTVWTGNQAYLGRSLSCVSLHKTAWLWHE